MRHLLLALPFALLPLVAAQAHEAHEHGVGRLNAALDGQTLELELQSPAMNLVGFEHPATTDADKAKVAAVRALLDKPLELFNLPKAAGCVVANQELESPLFGDPAPEDADDDDDDDDHAPEVAGTTPVAGAEHHHDHSEIHAHYQFTCATPAALKTLDLGQV